jgi:hypothetical protein
MAHVATHDDICSTGSSRRQIFVILRIPVIPDGLSRFDPLAATIELILAQRDIVVSYETVRRWCKKFAASFADRLRRRRPRPRDKWVTVRRTFPLPHI